MVISVVTLSENLPEAMQLLQTALTHPRFDGEAVTRVRTQIIQGLQQGDSEPPTVARRAFRQGFLQRPSLWPCQPTATPPACPAITPEDLRGFAKSHWVGAAARSPWPATSPPPPPPKLIARHFQAGAGNHAAAAAADRQAGPSGHACHCRCRCRSPP